MSESIDLRVLGRYFDGTATPAERDEVVSWIGADLERRTAVAELAASWASDARTLEARYDTDAAWSRIASQLHFPTRRSQPPRHVARAWQTTKITAWAASLVIGVSLGAWWLAVRRGPPPVQTPPSERVYQTARAQRAMVRLSDGSEVTLNADSRLRIPPEFGPANRELHLEGEAFFSVVHDSTAPFVVRTTRGIARDLGTKFAVRAYTDDRRRQLEVVVAEGAVAIAAIGGRDSLVLRAAEAGRVTADGELRAEHGIDVHLLLGWTEGRLEFKNMPLRDVVPVLARWYDADVRIGDDALGDYPITATLTGERFTEAVENIARVINARVVKHGATLVLIRIPARG